MELDDLFPRDLRPFNQLYFECASCKERFRSGDHICFDVLKRAICQKCYDNAKTS